jgi:hypothetical protein
MSDMESSNKSNYQLVHQLTTVIAGWNLFVVVTFVGLIGLSAMLNFLLGQVLAGAAIFWGSAIIAASAGVVSGYFGARRLYRYFSGFQMIGSYVWLTVMLYLAMRTFPTQLFFATGAA